MKLLIKNKEENKRFFYIANRLQLLNAMIDDLKKEEIGCCLQERDGEIIKKIRKEDFETILNNTHIQKYTNKLYKGNVNFVRQNYSLLQEFAKKENNSFANVAITDFLNEKVRQQKKIKKHIVS